MTSLSKILIIALAALILGTAGALLYSAIDGGSDVAPTKVVGDNGIAQKIKELEPKVRDLERTTARTEASSATGKSRDEYELDSGAPGTALAAGAAQSFASLEASVGASIALAVAPFGSSPPTVLGSDEGRHAWSSIKVPILVTLMKQGHLSPEQQDLASGALTASDNEAAAGLFAQIGSNASSEVEETLNEAAPSSPTEVATAPPPSGAASTYGQTLWSPAASADFFRSLGCNAPLGPNRTGYVLDLMASVIDEQQWGLAHADFPGASYKGFKAGWGPEGSASGPYLVRQSGIVKNSQGEGFAVTMVVQSSSGSFEAGVTALDQVARWLAGEVGPATFQPCAQ